MGIRGHVPFQPDRYCRCLLLHSDLSWRECRVSSLDAPHFRNQKMHWLDDGPTPVRLLCRVAVQNAVTFDECRMPEVKQTPP